MLPLHRRLHPASRKASRGGMGVCWSLGGHLCFPHFPQWDPGNSALCSTSPLDICLVTGLPRHGCPKGALVDPGPLAPTTLSLSSYHWSWPGQGGPWHLGCWSTARPLPSSSQARCIPGMAVRKPLLPASPLHPQAWLPPHPGQGLREKPRLPLPQSCPPPQNRCKPYTHPSTWPGPCSPP